MLFFNFFYFFFFIYPVSKTVFVLGATLIRALHIEWLHIFWFSSSISLDDGVDALHGGRPGLFSIRSKSGTKIGSQEIQQHFGQVLL
jgi:hypothetical protein